MIYRHTISFKHAAEGIIWAIKTQPNYIIHFTFSFLALIGGFFLRIEKVELLLIITLIFLGLAIETINTAIEKATDAISTDFHSEIKLAKDVAAGAMLIFSIGAVIVAGSIFLPRIISLLFTF